MTAIIRPRVWTQQPQFVTGIDWSNPLASGLLFCQQTHGSSVIDASRHISGSQGSAGAVAYIGSSGTGLDFNATAPVQIATATNAVFNLSGACTILALFSPDNAAGGSYGQYIGGSGNADASASQGAIRIKDKIGATWGSLFQDGLTTLSSGALYLAGFRRSGAAGAWSGDILLNGESDGAISTATNPSTQQIFSIGSYGATTSFGLPFDGKIYGFWVWDRAISLIEFKRFYDNPWQIFRPRVT